MSGYKSFAVAGAGNIGKYIAEALIDQKAKGAISTIIILSRTSNGYEELVKKGAKVVAVDYKLLPSIQSALSGIDVVISTLGGRSSDHMFPGLECQENLALGAKAAGVQLFVPSEFGNEDYDYTQGLLGVKTALLKRLKDEIRLPYVVFYTGLFTDQLFDRQFTALVGFDLDNGISIPGSGTVGISWTARPDIGRYVAHVLTTLPKDRLAWSTFRIEAERASFNQIVESYKARTGKDVRVSHRPRKEFEEALARNPADIVSFLILEWDSGRGVVGGPGEEVNTDFPAWNPKKVVDVLVEIYGE